ncbi:hypothetical protein [Pantoea sp. 1B4]|uniref:hypothetical protein n=1 Tax=Pantoea sp. 1B4 TaxID=2804760 RepID=UPI001AA23141|nr:hypothetical protein [Pantoea sp. 1B4]MBN1088114.1 hypothetical protein [Pantoea sp. 1B4]
MVNGQITIRKKWVQLTDGTADLDAQIANGYLWVLDTTNADKPQQAPADNALGRVETNSLSITKPSVVWVTSPTGDPVTIFAM